MQSNDFLPEGYNVPSNSDKYMKFLTGENRFRVLSEKAILGYEWWVDTEDGKRSPRRVPMSQTIPVEEVDEPEEIKHFWAFVIWNYKMEKVQILEITQRSIQKKLKALLSDEDWGSPRGYDIVITKTGESKETRYEVMPKPAKKLDEGIIKLYEDMNINLNALYEGEDPFNSKKEEKIDIEDIPDKF